MDCFDTLLLIAYLKQQTVSALSADGYEDPDDPARSAREVYLLAGYLRRLGAEREIPAHVGEFLSDSSRIREVIRHLDNEVWEHACSVLAYLERAEKLLVRNVVAGRSQDDGMEPEKGEYLLRRHDAFAVVLRELQLRLSQFPLYQMEWQIVNAVFYRIDLHMKVRSQHFLAARDHFVNAVAHMPPGSVREDEWWLLLFERTS